MYICIKYLSMKTIYALLKEEINNDSQAKFLITLKSAYNSDIRLLLQITCRNNNFKYFELILDNYKLDNDYYIMLLKFIISFGDFKFIEKLFKKIIFKQEEINDLLSIASLYKDSKLVTFLLDNGADINSTNILNEFTYNIDYFKYLISRGCKITNDRYSPIISAVKYKEIEIIKYLVEDLKIDISYTETSPLKYTYDINIIEYLVDHGADVNVLDETTRNIVINDLRYKKIKHLNDNIK